jgi:hypothetical protein
MLFEEIFYLYIYAENDNKPTNTILNIVDC